MLGLKRVRVNRRQYRTRFEARSDVFDHMERHHNPRRAKKIETLNHEDASFVQPSVTTE
jgi:putative transposase